MPSNPRETANAAYAELREAVLDVADGVLGDPCWCGEDWWAVHDAHADERKHSAWCGRLRDLVMTKGEV